MKAMSNFVTIIKCSNGCSYNGGSDSKYAKKFSYIYVLFTSATGNKNQ